MIVDFRSSQDSPDSDTQPEGDSHGRNSGIEKTVGKLGRLLAKDDLLGEFTFGGPAACLPGLPGLEIDGFGPVSLPLTDAAIASRLSQYGRLTSFGDGNHGEPGTAQAHIWELDRNQVRFANPQWESSVVTMTAMIAERLGCPDLNLGVHLYKLLLYGPGSHFVKHQDTEKEEGMFATLVIQLPSEHKGGELVVYDHQQDREDGGSGSTQYVHDFGAKAGTAAFAPHYAVHFADAEHELKPVTEGYRLALVYSLCWPSDLLSQPDLHLAQASRAQLASCLKSLSQSKTSLHLFLKRLYSEASIGRRGIQALTGIDRKRMDRLASANRGLDPGLRYSIYLVYGEKTYGHRCGTDHGSELVALYDEDGSELPLERQCMSDFVLGQLLNPNGVESYELWQMAKSVGPRGTSCACLEDTHLHKSLYPQYMVYMVPETQGVWGLARLSGIDATFRRLWTDQARLTPDRLDSLLATLPLVLQQQTIQQSFRDGDWTQAPYVPADPYGPPSSSPSPVDGKNLTARMLDIVVSRKFTACIPTFFFSIDNPLTAAMIPIYAACMKQPALWNTIRPLLLERLPMIPYALSLSLCLVRAAIGLGVAETVWQGFLAGIAAVCSPLGMNVSESFPPVQNPFEPVCETMAWALRSPRVWQVGGFGALMAVKSGQLCDSDIALVLGIVLATIDDKNVTESERVKLLELIASKKHVLLMHSRVLQQLEAAIHVPRVWEVVLPVARQSFGMVARSDGTHNSFKQCMKLLLALASASPANPSTWDPLLEILPAVPIWPAELDPFPPGMYRYHSPDLKSILVEVATHPCCSTIWPVIRPNLIHALTRCNRPFDAANYYIHLLAFGYGNDYNFFHNRFGIEGRVSPSDWLDQQLQKHDRPLWIDLIPPTFFSMSTPIPSTARIDHRVAQEHLWPLLLCAQHVPSISNVVAAYCSIADQNNNAQMLQAPVRVLLHLRALGDMPESVVRAVAPMVHNYLDGWARIEKPRLEQILAAGRTTLIRSKREELESVLRRVSEELSLWEAVEVKNAGARFL